MATPENSAPSTTRWGKVFLVGAGPGDPGLITLRGLRCLEAADLILYDGLVNPLLLRHSRAQAVRTCRTEGPEGLRLPQEEINARLIEAARQGLTVVRLKGGDPFIFGRGSEEAAALAAAGVPFEVVPGITAATAAAVYSGISLTHREHASAVAFVTGHEDPAKADSVLDYEVLSRFPGTLVFYMALHRLEWIVKRLLLAGKPPETPAAVISRATTPFQRTVTAPLKELPDAVRSAGLHAPSLVIVGDCVRLRARTRWFEERPLFGKVVGITRPEEQADTAIDRALELGAQPVVFPTVTIGPPEDWSQVDAVLERLHEFDWLICTSVNGVTGLLQRLWDRGGDVRRLARCRLAAIGPATAAAFERFGLRCDVVPAEYRAEALAAALEPLVAGQRLLWARASRGREVLREQLTAAGASVETVVVYSNRDVEQLPAAEQKLLEAGQVDWIGLSSPSIARNMARLLTPAVREHLGHKTRLCAISPLTAAAAEEAGLPIAAVAQEYTWEGIFQAIISAEKSATE